MTVDELRAAIDGLPGEMRVMVNGYEGGLVDPVIVPPTEVELNTHDSDVYGPHDFPGQGWEEPKGTVRAIIISRNSR